MSICEILLEDEDKMIQLGETVALTLMKGDLVALSGDLGTGKSTLARAIVRTLVGDDELDVPSPTFTLVQYYPEAWVPVTHADLYRLSSGSEIDELGLYEALAEGIVLVEWPERAGDFLSAATFTVTFSHEGQGRIVIIETDDDRGKRLSRSLLIRNFLEENGRRKAQRHYLSSDASSRDYEMITSKGYSEILMNTPSVSHDLPVKHDQSYNQIAHLADNSFAFVGMDRLLRAKGFYVPEILAEDLDAGLLLLEHLGHDGIVDSNGEPIHERYEACARLLAHIHHTHWPQETLVNQGIMHHIPDFDRDAMFIEVELLNIWYIPYMMGRPLDEKQKMSFKAAWNVVFDHLDKVEKSLVLRDFHSPNIIWRNEAKGKDRIGLIDFQDAVIGPTPYDLASLAQDARVTIQPDFETQLITAYGNERRQLESDFNQNDFCTTYAIMAAQRNSKILGIFVRLDQQDGKPQYLQHLPRIRTYLARSLAHHPVLRPLQMWYEENGLLSGV